MGHINSKSIRTIGIYHLNSNNLSKKLITNLEPLEPLHKTSKAVICSKMSVNMKNDRINYYCMLFV